MGLAKTRRFHALRGPDSLFEHAPAVLRCWTSAGVDVSGEHVQQRFAERGIDSGWFTDFDPEPWQVVTCDVLQKQKAIGCITARRPIDGQRKRWLWAVFVHEHLVTAWIRDNSRTQAVAPDTVTTGAFWDAVDRKHHQEIAEAEAARFEAERLASAERLGEGPPAAVPKPPKAMVIAGAPARSDKAGSPGLRRWIERLLGKLGRRNR